MRGFLLSSILISAVFAIPASRTSSVNPENGFAPFIEEAENAKKEMSALSAEERDGISKVFVILADPATSSADKIKNIDALMKDAPQEAQTEVHTMAEKSTQLSDWLTERLKSEDATVSKVATSLVQLMMNMDFIMSPATEKQTKVSALVDGLTADQKTALEKIDKDAETKEHELGLDEE